MAKKEVGEKEMAMTKKQMARHEKSEGDGVKAVSHRRSYDSKGGKSTKGNTKMC